VTPASSFQPKPNIRPWAPFKNLADFEYTETAVGGLLSKALVDKQLAGINSTWAVGSLLSIKSYRDMENVLSEARKYFVQVNNGIFIISSVLGLTFRLISVHNRIYHGHI
jgi:hypothetical protein